MAITNQERVGKAMELLREGSSRMSNAKCRRLLRLAACGNCVGNVRLGNDDSLIGDRGPTYEVNREVEWSGSRDCDTFCVMHNRCLPIIRKALHVVRPQFRLNFAGGIHGVPHWSRVWVHGRALAAAVDVNPQVLAWFAFLHDSQRHNDHHDPQHGRRAADFAVRLRREGVIAELAAHEFEHLCEAMRLHSDGHTTAEPAIMACWDADRLDLARVGIRPHPSRLCTSTARQPNLIASAMRLATRTRRRAIR
jgi:uncharacterized protein